MLENEDKYSLIFKFIGSFVAASHLLMFKVGDRHAILALAQQFSVSSSAAGPVFRRAACQSMVIDNKS